MSRFTKSSLLRYSYLALLITGTFLLAGCQRGTGNITGKVTYLNKSLKGGTVLFAATEGRQSFFSTISEEGTYSVPSVIAGTYKICVDTSNLKGESTGSRPKAPEGKMNKDKDAPTGGSGSGSSMKALNASRYVSIPAKYAKEETTDLIYEYAGGDQTYDIELK